MVSEKLQALIDEEVQKGIDKFKDEYVNTTFEKNKLYNYLGGNLISLLKKHNAFIAGGTITSLFSNREINDIDIYFRDELSLIKFIHDVWAEYNWSISYTKKAILMIHDTIKIQLIHFKYFNNPEEIFNTFDFSVCMGCFDFKTEKFILHSDFLKHNSQRILKFNNNTAFPIVSLLRVKKYEEKGYKISKAELIRIVLTCMQLKINTYDQLKEQLGGMYGINYDKLFKEEKDEEFDLQKAIDKIATVPYNENYFIEPEATKFEELEKIVSVILDEPMKVFEINGVKYTITPWGEIKRARNKSAVREEEIDPRDVKIKIYKFVSPTEKEGVYSSFARKEFTYEIGKEIAAFNHDYYDGILYFNQKEYIDYSTYVDAKEKVLIEAEFNWDDLIDINDRTIKVKKCFVIREVPEEEWKQWL